MAAESRHNRRASEASIGLLAVEILHLFIVN